MNAVRLLPAYIVRDLAFKGKNLAPSNMLTMPAHTKLNAEVDLTHTILTVGDSARIKYKLMGFMVYF
jgi:hypothetical protein